MRRMIGLVMVGVGAFALVLAPLLRFYAYPSLAVVPIDQDTVSVSHGPAARIFDTKSLSNVTTDLTSTRTVRGDVEASEDAPEGTVVWVTTVSSKDADGVARSRSVERVAIDRHTGEAVNCCGEYLESEKGVEQDVEHEGLVFKFPFNTQKRDYDFWDSTVKAAMPARYDGEETIEGVDVYRFVQTIEPTVTSTDDVPASILGLDEEGNVRADRMYSNTRTLWIEPRTGVIIKGQEEQYNTIAYEGEDRLITTDVTIGYDDLTIKKNADEYGPAGDQLELIRNVLPLVLLVAGLLLVGLGFVLARTGGNGAKRRAETSPESISTLSAR